MKRKLFFVFMDFICIKDSTTKDFEQKSFLVGFQSKEELGFALGKGKVTVRPKLGRSRVLTSQVAFMFSNSVSTKWLKKGRREERGSIV